MSACTERARKSIHISRQIKREPKQRAFTDVRPTCCQTNRGLGEAVCSIYSRYSPLSTCPTSGHKMCYMLCVQARVAAPLLQQTPQPFPGPQAHTSVFWVEHVSGQLVVWCEWQQKCDEYIPLLLHYGNNLLSCVSSSAE